MSPHPLLLAALLQQKQWHRYGMFQPVYDKAPRKVDRRLEGSGPSRAQFHRWTSGDLKRLPHTDHCRVLEEMFPRLEGPGALRALHARAAGTTSA